MNNYVHRDKFYMHIDHASTAKIELKFKHFAEENMQKNSQRISLWKTCRFSLSSLNIIEALSTKLIARAFKLSNGVGGFGCFGLVLGS